MEYISKDFSSIVLAGCMSDSFVSVQHLPKKTEQKQKPIKLPTITTNLIINFSLAAMGPQFSRKLRWWQSKNVEIATSKIVGQIGGQILSRGQSD